MRPHLDPPSTVVLLHLQDEAAELNATVPPSIARQHMRRRLDVLKVAFVLVHHFAEDS